MKTKVDYSFSFAPRHRITLSRPQASMKTLADIAPESLQLSWSYQSLAEMPVNIWHVPPVSWGLQVTLFLNGEPMTFSSWKRPENRLPGLCLQAERNGVFCNICGMAAESGDVFKIVWQNTGAEPVTAEVSVEHNIGGWVISNPAWIDGNHPNILLTMQDERADRVLAVGVGADEYPIAISDELRGEISVPMPDGTASTAGNPGKAMTLRLHLAAGESKTEWLVRPYEAYEADITDLQQKDREKELSAAMAEWETWLSRSAELIIPDEGVGDAFYACLADLFVMRERDSAGHIVTSCGTSMYRSTNAGEPTLVCTVIDQLGYDKEALAEQPVHIEAQGDDGNWSDPKGWAHHLWNVAGFKARMIWEHYMLTRDKKYLSDLYPRLLSMSRWQEKMRASTRKASSGLNFGLMPRGMGDCGLMNGSDYFGVFIPHNLYCVYADGITLEAAKQLDRPVEEIRELEAIYGTARNDLKKAIYAGAVEKDGFKIIPCVAGKTGGSSYGALAAHYPCGVLDGDDPLLLSTFACFEKNISAGGQPIGNGWMPNGCWVAISLDNTAMAHLARGDGDKASSYLYSALNYATPLTTWCEERGHEAGSAEKSGDLQHLWTPVAVCSYIRNALAFECENELRLAAGTPREWLADGETIGCRKMRTHYGELSYTLSRNGNQLSFKLDAEKLLPGTTVRLYTRTPEQLPILSVDGSCHAEIDRESILIKAEGKPIAFGIYCK